MTAPRDPSGDQPTEVVPSLSGGRADTAPVPQVDPATPAEGLRRLFPTGAGGHLGRARTSTVVLGVLFLAFFALWITVRPATPSTAGTSTPVTEAPAEPSATTGPTPATESSPTTATPTEGTPSGTSTTSRSTTASSTPSATTTSTTPRSTTTATTGTGPTTAAPTTGGTAPTGADTIAPTDAPTG